LIKKKKINKLVSTEDHWKVLHEWGGRGLCKAMMA
jgi:hypothetical protein